MFDYVRARLPAFVISRTVFVALDPPFVTYRHLLFVLLVFIRGGFDRAGPWGYGRVPRDRKTRDKS